MCIIWFSSKCKQILRSCFADVYYFYYNPSTSSLLVMVVFAFLQKGDRLQQARFEAKRQRLTGGPRYSTPYAHPHSGHLVGLPSLWTLKYLCDLSQHNSNLGLVGLQSVMPGSIRLEAVAKHCVSVLTSR